MYINAKEYVDYLIDNIIKLDHEHNLHVQKFEEAFRILDDATQSAIEMLENYANLTGMVITDTALDNYLSRNYEEYDELQEEYDKYIQSYVDRISNEIVLTTMIIENHLEEEINGLEIMNKLLDLIK